MSNAFEFNYSNGTGCYSTSFATFWNPDDFNQFDGDDFNVGGVGIPLKCASCCFELVFESIQFVFLVFVPILTMRVFAEETRQRTDQLLFTLPLRAREIVGGIYPPFTFSPGGGDPEGVFPFFPE